MISKLFRRPEPLQPTELSAYRADCEALAAILAKNGITHIKPYQDPAVPRLLAHRDPRRAIETLRSYVEILAAADREGEDLNDSKRLLWRMLRKMRLSPLSDIFEKIESHHVLEIYTPDNWQIFRNLNFFRYVSLSIDEVATFYWPRDSKRHMKIHLDALAVAAQLRFGTLRKTLDVRTWPAHLIRELVGEGWLIEIRLLYISPLRGPAREFLGLVINESKTLAEGAQPSGPEVLPL